MQSSFYDCSYVKRNDFNCSQSLEVGAEAAPALLPLLPHQAACEFLTRGQIQAQLHAGVTLHCLNSFQIYDGVTILQWKCKGIFYWIFSKNFTWQFQAYQIWGSVFIFTISASLQWDAIRCKILSHLSVLLTNLKLTILYSTKLKLGLSFVFALYVGYLSSP